MNEKLDVVRGMLHGFDYSDAWTAAHQAREPIVNAQEFALAKWYHDRVKDRCHPRGDAAGRPTRWRSRT